MPGIISSLPDPNRSVYVLAVSPFVEDHQALRNIFALSNWNLDAACDRASAQRAMRCAPKPVVICETRLPDGSWRDVLEDVTRMLPAAKVIVATRLADDRLWAEVLNLGAYDLIAKPFHPPEVLRLVSLAWRNWRNECERAQRRTAMMARGA